MPQRCFSPWGSKAIDHWALYGPELEIQIDARLFDAAIPTPPRDPVP
jgi:hypothetical protein